MSIAIYKSNTDFSSTIEVKIVARVNFYLKDQLTETQSRSSVFEFSTFKQTIPSPLCFDHIQMQIFKLAVSLTEATFKSSTSLCFLINIFSDKSNFYNNVTLDSRIRIQIVRIY